MNIAFVSEHASPLAVLGRADGGGQNVFVDALACELANRGRTVTVYTRRDAAHLPSVVETERGYSVVHIDAGPAESLPKDALYPLMPEFAARLIDEFARRPHDIVHSHFWMSGIAAARTAERTGTPWVHTYHALGDEKRAQQGSADTSPAARVLEERAILRAADRIIATSSAEVFTHRRNGADPAKVKLVPCGVDFAFFERRAQPCAGMRGRRHRLITVGRFVERKGLADTIEALRFLDDTELIVAGGPPLAELERDPEAARLLAAARRWGVSDRVTFVGGIPHTAMPALLASGDVVVCTPWYEPFGMVALEAMASGVPIVVSAVGGFLDSVVDGLTGLHVPARNPRAIARAVRTLLRDPVRRARLGERGRERALRLYAWPKVARDIERVYVALSRATPMAAETSA